MRTAEGSRNRMDSPRVPTRAQRAHDLAAKVSAGHLLSSDELQQIAAGAGSEIAAKVKAGHLLSPEELEQLRTGVYGGTLGDSGGAAAANAILSPRPPEGKPREPPSQRPTRAKAGNSVKAGSKAATTPRRSSKEAAIERVESSRRVLDEDNNWTRKTREELTTPARRSRVGLNAPPLHLAAALIRQSHSSGVRKKPKTSHKMPRLDLSSITLTYGVSDSLRAAAIKSLDLRTLSARMPGVPRPLSRELPALIASRAPPPHTDRGGALLAEASSAPPGAPSSSSHRRQEAAAVAAAVAAAAARRRRRRRVAASEALFPLRRRRPSGVTCRPRLGRSRVG